MTFRGCGGEKRLDKEDLDHQRDVALRATVKLPCRSTLKETMDNGYREYYLIHLLTVPMIFIMIYIVQIINWYENSGAI
ncbi:MAG: hypothetical protein CEE41_03460 [Hadesarchaea archaeon B3_Hades]|nr:MAG: hypothetical protein CEE41_03460 [Hadesarchaea archaeon B3_Hades]